MADLSTYPEPAQLRNPRRERKFARLLRHYRIAGLTALAFALGALLSFAVHQFAERQAITGQQFDLFRELSALTAALEGLIGENMVVVAGVRAEIAVNPEISVEKFERLAEQLIQNRSHIRHIALAPDLVISSVYPRAGNESALGLDLSTNPEQRGAMMMAVQSRKMILAGPLTLVQGGSALVARVPVFLADAPDQLWGAIATVINLDPLLRDAGILDLRQQYEIAIRGVDGLGAQGAVFFGDASLFETQDSLGQNAVLVDIQLPEGSWQLVARPWDGWHAPPAQHALILTLGLIFSILLSLAVNLRLRIQRERKLSLRRLERQASIDQLTGLCSRYMFNRQLVQLIAEAGRDEQEFSLLFIDVDNFKEINDSLGHQVGDELLTQIGRRLQRSCRAGDLNARLGGDEFGMVFKNIGEPSRAELMAKKFIDALSQPYDIHGNTLHITASIGIAIYPYDGHDSTTLLQHADTAMYSAKSAGRDTIRFFSMQMRNQADRYIDMHNDILKGLKEKQFLVYYQPIYDQRTRDFDKCEALIRWQHPDKGFISPAEFIPIAEQTGSIRAIGQWVLEQALTDYPRFRDAGFDLEISINRSRNEFREHSSVEQWLEAIDRHQVPAHRITIEITESLLMEGNKRQLQAIHKLKSRGLKLALDDFGTGYSAMNYLRQFPVDYLKIDKSFIDGICESRLDRTLVRVIIQMAKALDIEVIAEGIEREEQWKVLQQEQCELIQGFFFSKPLPRDELIKFLTNRQPAPAH